MATQGVDGSVVIEVVADDSKFQQQVNSLANALGNSIGTAMDDAITRLNESLSQIGESAEGAGRGVGDSFGEGSYAHNSVSSLNAVLQNAFGHLLADAIENIATKIYEVGKQAWQAGINFESAFAGVKKTVDETTDISYADLEKQLRDMSLEVPSTIEEISGVAEAAGQLGIEAPEIASFTRTMIDLGESTNLSAETAASELAKFANITKLSKDEYGNLGAAIVDLGNNYATTEADIVNMSQRLAATAHAAGINEQGILAMSTALSSVGIEAEAGGTAMSTFIKKVQTAVETQSKSLDQYAQIAGMTSEEFTKAFKSDGVSAINAFITGLSNLDKSGGSSLQVLNDMGIKEIRLSNAILALSGSQDMLTRTYQTANEAWEEGTALQEEAAKRYETTESQIEMLKNAINDLFISISQQFTLGLDVSPIVDAVTKINDALKKDGFEGMLDAIQEVFDISDKTVEAIKGFAEQLPALLSAASDALITILHSLEEVAGNYISTFVDVILPKLIDGLNWLAEHGEVVNGIIRTFVGLWAGGMLAKGVENVGALVVNVEKFASSLNTASGKISAALAGLQAAVVVGTVISGIIDDAAAKLRDANKLDSETKAVIEMNKAYEESLATAEENVKMANNSADCVERWWGQLQNLVDENGKVTGSLDEAESLISRINQETGLHIEVIDGQIQSYQDLTASIDDYIDAMRRQAVVEYYKEPYGEAIANIDDVKKQYEEAHMAKLQYYYQEEQINKELEKLKERKIALDSDYYTALFTEGDAAKATNIEAQMQEIDSQISGLQEAYKEAENEFTKAATQESPLYNTVSQYEEVIGKFEGYFKEEAEKIEDTVDDTNSTLNGLAESTSSYLSDEEAKHLHYLAEIAKESGEITEEEYYNRIESIANQLDEESKLYEQYTKEVVKGRRKLAEALEKETTNAYKTIYKEAKTAVKNELSEVKSGLKELVSAYKKTYDDIIDNRDDYKSRLMGESIFSVTTETDKETGTETTTYAIDNMKKRLAEREKYAKEIDKLRKRSINENMLSELEGLNTDQAMTFAEQMNKMSDTEWDELNTAYARLDKTTTDLANKRYAGELESLQNGFISEAQALFTGLSDDLKQAGIDGLMSFIEGFDVTQEDAADALQKEIDGVIDNINSGLSANTVDISDTIAQTLGDTNIGESLVDNIVAAINDNQDSITGALETIMKNTGIDLDIKSDMESKSADASQSGYTAANNVTASNNTAQTATPVQSTTGGKIAVEVTGTITDKGGRIIADLVNKYNNEAAIIGGT